MPKKFYKKFLETVRVSRVGSNFYSFADNAAYNIALSIAMQY